MGPAQWGLPNGAQWGLPDGAQWGLPNGAKWDPMGPKGACPMEPARWSLPDGACLMGPNGAPRAPARCGPKGAPYGPVGSTGPWYRKAPLPLWTRPSCGLPRPPLSW